MMDIVEESELSKKKVCETLKLNRSRYYRWNRRYEEHGFAGLKDKKPTPNGPVHSLLDEEKEAIIEYALDNPDTRHRKLAYELQNEDIVYVSPSSVYRVLKAEGLINERTEPQQDTSADGKIEVEKPNKMWHLDITYIPIKDIHAYQITVLDGCSLFYGTIKIKSNLLELLYTTPLIHPSGISPKSNWFTLAPAWEGEKIHV